MATPTRQFRELPDEVLKRMGLTRERWHQIQEAQQAREAAAPDAGAPAPDFELPRLGDRSQTVRLSDFKGKRPVALIFGSYT